MSGSTKIYRMRPIVKHDIPIEIPKCVYAMKNIHSKEAKEMVPECTDHVSTSKKNPTIFDQNNQHSPGMADLLAKQEDVLKQLADLQKQIQSIKLDLKITPEAAKSKKINPAPKLPVDLPDFVVNANPANPPYSLEILQKILSNTINLRVVCYLHSTVSSLTENAQKLEKSLIEFTENPAVPSVNIRLIWKNVEADTEFIISHFPIRGEVNLLRYLSRAIPSQLSIDSDSNSVELENILDTCYLLVKAKTKSERAGYLTSINKSLGKSQWLGGRNAPSVVDIAAYSSVKQSCSKEINASLTKWYQRCETIVKS